MTLDSFGEAARGGSQWATHWGGTGYVWCSGTSAVSAQLVFCFTVSHIAQSEADPMEVWLEEHSRWQNPKSLSSHPLRRTPKLQVSSEQWLVKVLGECVISLVPSHHSKNLKWLTSVTAWLQLSCIWKNKG